MTKNEKIRIPIPLEIFPWHYYIIRFHICQQYFVSQYIDKPYFFYKIEYKSRILEKYMPLL